eukprot:COSAG04_NODE_3581_length_2692_cov_17.709603_2_plen_443_part_01
MAAAPRTLDELAALAGIELGELREFEEDLFNQLLDEQNVNAVAKHRLRKKYRDMRASQQLSTAQAKFEAFFERVGGADSLEGLQNVPVSTLPVAVDFIEGPGSPSKDALAGGVATAYAKADALLAEGPDPHSLTRDEIAAINLYTQDGWGGAVRNLFAPLNAALRSEERTDVKVYWGYIRLLQHALFKLPKDGSGVLFRGVKVTWIPLATLQAQLLQLAASADAAEIWWGFSSTSTSLQAVEGFLGQDGPRVIFTVDGGSSARDVRRYSHFQAGHAVPEDERLLPCGTAFQVKTVGSPAPHLLLVGLKQTDDILIQGGAPAAAPALLEGVPPEPEPVLAEPEPEPEPEPNPQQQKVSQLCGICGCEAATARQHLEAAGWDVQAAVESYFAAQEPEPEPEPQPQPQAAAPAGQVAEFGATGSIVECTVPEGATAAAIEACGAQG